MKNKNTSLIQSIRAARQSRSIKRAVLHNVEHGINDMPARGLVYLPFTPKKLLDGTLDSLNKKLEAYDVRVDSYSLKIRDKSVDRIMVTSLDKRPIEPSPAYQSALQNRFAVNI